MATPGISLTSVDGLPNIIPAADATRSRTLVLCFDGTGDQFDADNSNVIQLFTLLQKDNHAEQMVYYQAGIGTYTIPQIATPFYATVSQAMDAAIAWNLDAHVMGGYEFLMQNYQGGDKICIFGFSRGAYTARSLAGMVHKVGLLPACNHQQVPFAYKMYSRTDEVGWKQSVAFKKAFSMDVDIEFVGVWDTVCSVGLIPKRLPFVSSNTAIRYFRHAVSLDERRAKFKANLYNRPTDAESKLGVQPGDMPKPSGSSVYTYPRGMKMVKEFYEDYRKRTSKNSAQQEEEDDRLETQYDPMLDVSCQTDVLEVWFAGCHCDVGGGSVPNDTPHNLARIPLRWMIRQCFLANTGIRFHTDLLPNVGLDPTSLYPAVKKRPPEIYVTAEKLAALRALQSADTSQASISPTATSSSSSTPAPPSALVPPALHRRQDSSRTLVNGHDVASGAVAAQPSPRLTEEEEDLLDAVCPIYDQLELAKGWWILEVLPMVQRYQRENNTWAEELTVNLGGPRYIPHPTADTPLRVHRTVKMRMAAQGLVETVTDAKSSYEPRAKLRHDPIWVE